VLWCCNNKVHVGFVDLDILLELFMVSAQRLSCQQQLRCTTFYKNICRWFWKWQRVKKETPLWIMVTPTEAIRHWRRGIRILPHLLPLPHTLSSWTGESFIVPNLLGHAYLTDLPLSWTLFCQCQIVLLHTQVQWIRVQKVNYCSIKLKLDLENIYSWTFYTLYRLPCLSNWFFKNPSL
jgi:hypothetical protein